MPLFSIIIPVYNCESFLKKCLDSILSQTFLDWEAILIDDGSPDNSGKICDHYVEKDNRIKCIHKQNGGVSSARNLGLDKATGDYITFIDADDYVLPSYLERLASKPKYDIVFSGLQRFGAENIKMFGFEEKEYATIADLLEDYLKTLEETGLTLGGLNFICSKALRRSIIAEHKLRFNENMIYGEDTCFIFDFLKYSRNAAQVKGNDYFYYTPATSHSYRFTIDGLQNHCVWYSKALKELGEKHHVLEVTRSDGYCVSVFVRYIKGLRSYSYRDLRKELKEFKARVEFPIWQSLREVKGPKVSMILKTFFSIPTLFYLALRIYKSKYYKYNGLQNPSF